jgi:hypothetical protein
MKLRVGFLLAAVALLPNAACSVLGIEFITGSGNPRTEKFDTTGFKAVEVHNAFQVDITRGDKFDVEVTADDNLVDFVKVTNDGSTLTVGVESGKNLRPRAGLKVAITMPELEGVTLSGACTGSVKGFKGGKDFNVKLSGASKLKGDVSAEKVEIEVSGASSVTLRGTAVTCDTEGSGASKVHLDDLDVTRAKVNLSGASSAAVHATEKLDYDLSGASSLDYHGHPTLGKHSTSGASAASEK